MDEFRFARLEFRMVLVTYMQHRHRSFRNHGIIAHLLQLQSQLLSETDPTTVKLNQEMTQVC